MSIEVLAKLLARQRIKRENAGKKCDDEFECVPEAWYYDGKENVRAQTKKHVRAQKITKYVRVIFAFYVFFFLVVN